MRLGGYALVLVGLFSAAYAVGERLPGHAHATDESAADAHPADAHPSDANPSDANPSDPGGAPAAMAADAEQLALSSSNLGYRLVIDEHTPTSLQFHIDRGGTAVTDFVDQHEALLHILVIRRDLTGYQHVHPAMAPDGTWTAEVDLAQPGAWRVVADSNPARPDAVADGTVALGVDVLVPGDMQPEPLPVPNDMVTVEGGVTVMRDGFDFTIEPAGDLAPYLGQPAHLVAFREGDLAYVHLHPQNDVLGDLQFTNDLPGPGTYRLFLQFIHADEVMTVPFTVIQESAP